MYTQPGAHARANAARHRRACPACLPQVMVYDMDQQRACWRTEGGHTETIFDCRFSSHDSNLMATASFDSSVRVWDVRTCKCARLGADGGAGSFAVVGGGCGCRRVDVAVAAVTAVTAAE